MSGFSKIGVIGAGNMGSGIAQKMAQEGLNVVMIDIRDEFVQKGLDTVRSLLQEGVDRKIFSNGQMEDTLSRITGTTDFNAVADADIVVEAVFEDKDVKSDLFLKLDKICSDKTILATNTSSFFVREFAKKTSRPDRFVGLHYFFHPAKNRLLEVIPHSSTTRDTLDKSLLLAKLHGKTPIVVKDAPGFAVNRFFVPFLNEAARMLEEGIADIPTIEEAAKQAFKIGMGPFELMNVTGIPIAVHSSATLGRELGPFYETSGILKAQMEKNENWDLQGKADESKLEPIIDRFYGVCLGVAAALVDEEVATIEDTDRGAKIGLRWISGPFEIMNRIGIEKTFNAVQKITEMYSDFTMPKVLAEQKATGKPFEFNFVDIDINAEIAFITLNRPEAMNALNETVFAQLDRCFSQAETDPAVKTIIFQGAGKAFVAGADINYFVEKIKADKIPHIFEFTKNGHDLFLRIENSDKLTIALLDGLSLGGGSELTLACQAVIATSDGSMAFPETGIGIYPGLGGMLRMTRHVGPELAKYYVFTGATLSVEDALSLGIITSLVKPSEVGSEIMELASKEKPDKYGEREIPDKFKPYMELCTEKNIEKLLSGELPTGVLEELSKKALKIIGTKAPLAIKLANDIINRQIILPVDEAVKIELQHLEENFSTSDALEGLSSLGKKRPVFKGQ